MSDFTTAQMAQVVREIAEDVREFWLGVWTAGDDVDWVIE